MRSVTRMRQLCADRHGQMAVELAVLVPVVVVVALTTANLARFVELCAQFDRTAPDMVVAHGVAPAGQASQAASVASVQEALERAMGVLDGLGFVEVRVEASAVSNGHATASAISFPVSSLLTEFTCTLVYHPWPGSFVLAGVSYQSPLALTHARTITVDRFRPGVVV